MSGAKIATCDSSAIIVKHINYNIPWRDGTIVLIVTSTCLLPITTTPDREIVYERIRFCNKDLTKITDLNYPAKKRHVVHHVFKIIETLTVSVFLHFPSLSVGKCACDVSAQTKTEAGKHIAYVAEM